MYRILSSVIAGATMLLASAAMPAMAQNLTLGSTNATSSHYQIAVGMGQAIEAGNPGATVTGGAHIRSDIAAPGRPPGSGGDPVRVFLPS